MKRVIERSQEIRDQIMRSTGPDVRNEVAELCGLVATLAAKVESLEASESPAGDCDGEAQSQWGDLT